jgi:hypothetical protein
MPVVDITDIENSLNNERISYLDLTHQLNNYNEIYNLNFYLKNMNTLELDKMTKVNQNIRAKVLRMKQEYMLMDYGIHEHKMRANILYTTLVVVSVIFIIVAFYVKGSMDKNTVIMISVVLGVLYLIIMLFILSANSKRRKYAWDQYYWSEMKKKS